MMIFEFKSSDAALRFAAVVEFATGLVCRVEGCVVIIDVLRNFRGYPVSREWLSAQAATQNALI